MSLFGGGSGICLSRVPGRTAGRESLEVHVFSASEGCSVHGKIPPASRYRLRHPVLNIHIQPDGIVCDGGGTIAIDRTARGETRGILGHIW